MNLYLLMIGIAALVVGFRLRVAPEDVTLIGIFRRAMRIGCLITGSGATFVALRGILGWE